MLSSEALVCHIEGMYLFLGDVILNCLVYFHTFDFYTALYFPSTMLSY